MDSRVHLVVRSVGHTQYVPVLMLAAVIECSHGSWEPTNHPGAPDQP